MTPWVLFPRLLSILAILGFLIAPMATSSAAMMDSPSATDETAAMSQGMPCCPDQKPAAPCPKSCPLAMLCMASCLPGALSASVVIPWRLSLAEVKVPGNDLLRPGLTDPPPPRPPRT